MIRKFIILGVFVLSISSFSKDKKKSEDGVLVIYEQESNGAIISENEYLKNTIQYLKTLNSEKALNLGSSYTDVMKEEINNDKEDLKNTIHDLKV